MALLDLEFSRISRSLGRCASSISSAQSDGFDAADDASGLFSESHRASGALGARSLELAVKVHEDGALAVFPLHVDRE